MTLKNHCQLLLNGPGNHCQWLLPLFRLWSNHCHLSEALYGVLDNHCNGCWPLSGSLINRCQWFIGIVEQSIAKQWFANYCSNNGPTCGNLHSICIKKLDLCFCRRFKLHFNSESPQRCNHHELEMTIGSQSGERGSYHLASPVCEQILGYTLKVNLPHATSQRPICIESKIWWLLVERNDSLHRATGEPAKDDHRDIFVL